MENREYWQKRCFAAENYIHALGVPHDPDHCQQEAQDKWIEAKATPDQGRAIGDKTIPVQNDQSNTIKQTMEIKPKAIINYKEVGILCEQYLRDIGTEKMVEDQQKDREKQIFEALLEARYGKAVWRRISNKIQSR